MSISTLGPALGMYLTRQYTTASRDTAAALEKLASGLKVNTAADAPSSVARIERLKSMISENLILASSAPTQTSVLGAASTDLTRLANQAASLTGSSPADQVRALVSALRAQAAVEVNGTLAYAGDAKNPEMIDVTTPATSGSLVGGRINGRVNLASETTVFENGGFRSKARMTLNVNGTNHSLLLASGSYNANEAAAEIQRAVGAQTSLVVGRDISISVVDGVITIGSLATGASSSVTASGQGAGTLNLTTAATSTRGTDARTEKVAGAPGPITLEYAGRSITFNNLNKQADALEAALASGTSSRIESALGDVRAALGSTKSTVDFTIGRLNEDLITRKGRVKVLGEELARLTEVDNTESTLDALKAQVRMEQAQWAMNTYREMQMSQARALFGTKD